jgi:hypothetical protein
MLEPMRDERRNRELPEFFARSWVPEEYNSMILIAIKDNSDDIGK